MSPRHLLRLPLLRGVSTQAERRIYEYEVDVHGQLFLSTTKLRNFTSCYKDPAFLSFFFSRVRLNDKDDETSTRLRRDGYTFLSPCGVEWNYIRPADTVLVYQKLSSEGSLSFAGSLAHPFDPTSLRVDSRGYVYHPSPLSPRASQRGKPSPYGPYSLLRSSLLLESFASTLELEEGSGGSFEWEGKRYEIGQLQEGDVWRGAETS